MYSKLQYISRGWRFLRNRAFPGRKTLSTLMIYGTDLCDSACKHCLIWTKRPVNYLPFDKMKEVMQSRCVTRQTTIGLEGGEFLLHPEALDILAWFRKHHPNVDLLTNALRPDLLTEALEKEPPRRLFISLDGDRDAYLHMRGKDGYEGILQILEKYHRRLPISLMFTLSPYNDFGDMEHVAGVAKRFGVDLRIGVYNDIAFFDTIEAAHYHDIGTLKSDVNRSISKARQLIEARPPAADAFQPPLREDAPWIKIREQIPAVIEAFPENHDFLVLYDEWRRGGLKLGCHSILDSLVVLPNGDVPICQNLDVLIGNVHTNTLDEIFNGPESIARQRHYSQNCNACWINFHRKYDVILYRTFERYFGRRATQKLMGRYWWERSRTQTYRQVMNP